jgi:glycerol-3-phosphate dehydrogenase (NAD(P)+)
VETVLWARRDDLAVSINETGQNPDYLPGHDLPKLLSATSDLSSAVAGTDVVIMAVPSHGFRNVFRALATDIDDDTPVVSLTKGIEEVTLASMTQVVSEEAANHDSRVTGVLTGPNLVGEIIAGQPTAAVIAMSHEPTAQAIQAVLMSPRFRVYTNDDVIGCELAGAMKNVMAIAAGMSDGLGFGDNTRAALLTRALTELTRLGTSLGGRPATFAGLAGIGDLIATCSSTQSRNHRVGDSLARGKTLHEITADMSMVAEGVKTTRGVLGLAKQAGVEMPIAEHVAKVLYEGMTPRDAVLSLMTREAKSENEAVKGTITDKAR